MIAPQVTIDAQFHSLNIRQCLYIRRCHGKCMYPGDKVDKEYSELPS